MEKGTWNKPRLDYKWIMVGISFLLNFVCLGFCSSNRSLYLSAITEALNIKRSVFSIGDSLRYIVSAILGVFFGSMVNRFGMKKLLSIGFLCLIFSMICYSFATNVVGFYIGSIVLGVGLAWTTTTMTGCIVNKWCKEKKGTIMGLVMAANGFGGALSVQIISPIIYQQGNLFGYRTAYRLISILLVVVGSVIMILFREEPRKRETYVEAGDKEEHRNDNRVGTDNHNAVKNTHFYIAILCIFLTGMMLQGVTGIAAAHMKDVNIDAAYIALVMSVQSLALAAFKLLTGALYDRYGLRVTTMICDVAGVFIMIMLAALSNTLQGRVLAMAYGILSALALPLETIMLPLFTIELFGDKSYMKILGIFVGVNTVGYAVGAPLINWSFDSLGSYKPMLYIYAIVFAVVMMLLQFTLTAVDKGKRMTVEKA